MSSYPSPRRQRDKLIAMRDAAAGAFEAARHKHIRLLGKAESISLDYIAGVATRAQVRVAVSSLYDMRVKVRQAAHRVRSYQDMLDKIAIREAREIKARALQTQIEAAATRPYISRPYMELHTVPQGA